VRSTSGAEHSGAEHPNSRAQPPEQVRRPHLAAFEHHLEPVEVPVVRVCQAERNTMAGIEPIQISLFVRENLA
jgi:hypothetical protein